jgi:ABC-type glycerol-3-phosphate transport system permease component
MKTLRQVALKLLIGVFATLTLVPFAFVLNNSFRTNNEMYHEFFGLPNALKGMVRCVGMLDEEDTLVEVINEQGETEQLPPRAAIRQFWLTATKGYRLGWTVLRKYLLNTLVVVVCTATGVVLLASISAYTLSRYRFPGHRGIFYFIIAAMMFPGVLTFVPSFMVVRELGLLNTYWVMILPYVAGGQVFATFIFKSFFDGLPEELFESARIDGAGHLQIYAHIVIPLSKPVLSVVLIMTTFGAWNNFLWPFVTLPEGELHPIASGLYVMATSPFAQNFSTLFSAYMVSSVPLLIIFTYATKPFIEGVTSGAFKA